MKIIRQTYHIKASVEKVWNAFVSSKEIDNWGGGPAKMDDKKGTKFSLWGHEIWGTNVEVTPKKHLVQEWYSNDDKDNPTKVTFTFHAEKDGTRVELLHEDVADKNAKSIDDGWKDFYLGPMKKYLEK